MNNDIRHRLLDIYTELSQYTYLNYIQTNNTIQRLETGIREIMRIPIDNSQNTNERQHTNNFSDNNSYTHIPVLNPGIYPTRIHTPIIRPPRTQPSSNQQSRGQTSGQTIGQTSGQTSGHRPTRTQPSISEDIRTTHTNLWTPIPRQHTNDTLASMLSNIFNMEQLTPVIVRPTQQQITNATEVISLQENMINTNCPILQTSFQEGDIIVRIKHCGHCFIQEGLISWFNQSVFCPVCRYDIREYPRQPRQLRQPRQPRQLRQPDQSNEPSTPNNTSTSTPINTSTSTRPMDIINDLSNTVVRNTSNRNINNNLNALSANLLNIFTTQLPDSIQQYINSNDNSHNNLNDDIFTIDYIIETPNSMYSSSLPLRTSQLNDNDNDSDSGSDIEDVVGDVDN